jgi:hypothetical protein
MIMNNGFKELREVIENGNGSIVAHSGMTASFKYGFNGCFLPYSRKIPLGQAQVKYMSKNWNKNICAALYDKLRNIIKSNRF